MEHQLGQLLSPSSGIQCVRTQLKRLLSESDHLDSWIQKRMAVAHEPFYSSIDLRDAGFKLAPVDANLFPAGFNNICPDDLWHAKDILRNLFQRHLGRLPKNVAILPEAHTKNRFYVDNLLQLREMFRRLEIPCELGWIPHSGDASAPEEPVRLESTSGEILTAYPFRREGSRLAFQPFEPDFILLNNDFSSGYPEFLAGLTQAIEPSARMGWHTRKKSDFFAHYNRLAGELALEAGLDPWRLQVTTRLVDNVDFDQLSGIDRVAQAVDDLIAEMRNQYATREINEKPFVFVKNNAGTYGMGIMRVESGQEMLELNRRERNKMAVGKNQLAVREVIVQEGIPTRFQIEGVYSEPVIYLLGSSLMGGFLRQNPTRGRGDNLNSKGMVFRKLCISDLRFGADRDLELEMVYGTIAKLSVAAISREIEKVEQAAHNASHSITVH